jgi:choline kinase
MTDLATNYPRTADSTADEYFNVTTSDTVDFPQGVARAIRADVGGTVVLVKRTGETATITMQDGEIFLGKVRRINTAGTSASGFLAYYK